MPVGATRAAAPKGDYDYSAMGRYRSRTNSVSGRSRRKPWPRLTIPVDELYAQARSVVDPRRLSEQAEAGGVGAAILAANGAVYTGVCIDTGSSMGSVRRAQRTRRCIR